MIFNGTLNGFDSDGIEHGVLLVVVGNDSLRPGTKDLKTISSWTKQVAKALDIKKVSVVPWMGKIGK